jgi:hypothetical protein
MRYNKTLANSVIIIFIVMLNTRSLSATNIPMAINSPGTCCVSLQNNKIYQFDGKLLNILWPLMPETHFYFCPHLLQVTALMQPVFD